MEAHRCSAGARSLTRVLATLTLGLMASLAMAPGPLRAENDLEANARLAGMVGQPMPEVKLLLSDGSTKTMADYRGRWVFLETGYTHCLPSEAVALAMSDIQRQLEKEPFTFIKVYVGSDPSFDDITLETHFDFAGVQAVFAEKRPAALEMPYVPVCYLVNPDGKIVWTGGGVGTADLRLLLAQAFGGKVNLPADFQQVTTFQRDREQAEVTYMNDSGSSATPLFKALNAEHPEDFLSFYRTLNDDDSKQVKARLMNTRLREPGFAASDSPLKWQILRFKAHGMTTTNPEGSLVIYRQLQARFPHSVQIAAMVLALGKHPRDYTKQELQVLANAVDFRQDDEVVAALIYALEDKGSLEMIPQLQRMLSLEWEQVHRQGFVVRHGPTAAVDRAVSELNIGADQPSTDLNVVWQRMANQLIAHDWKAADASAETMTKIAPQDGIALPVRAICALRQGDKTQAAAELQAMRDYPPSGHPCYLLAQGLVQAGQPVALTAEQIKPLEKDPRNIAAVLWIGAWLESQGKYQEAYDTYTVGLDLFAPIAFKYALFYAIRAGLPKEVQPKAAAPATAGI